MSKNPWVSRFLPCRAGLASVAALAAGLAGGVAASDAGSWVPDEAVLAGIAACEGESADTGLLASLCKNRREAVALVRLCEGNGDPATAVDAAMLARWDQRNAPYLRWVGEQAAEASSEPPNEEPLLWEPPAGDDGLGSLLAGTFEDQFRSLSRNDQKTLCAHSRRSIDAGVYDLQPPEA